MARAAFLDAVVSQGLPGGEREDWRETQATAMVDLGKVVPTWCVATGELYAKA